MQLTLPSNNQITNIVNISDSDTISNLTRKGWTQVSQQTGAYDSTTESLQLINTQLTSSGFIQYYSGVYNSGLVAANIAMSGLIAQTAIMATGYNTNLGYNLPVYPTNIASLTQMFTLVSAALNMGTITTGTIQTFADISGNIQSLPTITFCGLMLNYGFYCKGLWDAQNGAAPNSGMS